MVSSEDTVSCVAINGSRGIAIPAFHVPDRNIRLVVREFKSLVCKDCLENQSDLCALKIPTRYQQRNVHLRNESHSHARQEHAVPTGTRTA